MKKYYAKVQTDSGTMSLAVRAANKEDAKREIYEQYNINSIIQVSDKPIQVKSSIPQSSANLILGVINRSNKTSKRFNHWGVSHG